MNQDQKLRAFTWALIDALEDVRAQPAGESDWRDLNQADANLRRELEAIDALTATQQAAPSQATQMAAQLRQYGGDGGSTYHRHLLEAAALLEASAQREQPASFRSGIFSLLFNEWFATTDGNPSFQDCFVAGLNAQREQSTTSNPDEHLCKFYGVTTYADLVKAQAAHIEKLQDKLVKQDFAALQFPRKG